MTHWNADERCFPRFEVNVFVGVGGGGVDGGGARGVTNAAVGADGSELVDDATPMSCCRSNDDCGT